MEEEQELEQQPPEEMQTDEQGQAQSADAVAAQPEVKRGPKDNFKILVSDTECGTQIALFVNDDMKLQDLRDRFLTESKRMRRDGAFFEYNQQHFGSADLDRLVGELQLPEHATVQYSAMMFRVRVREGDAKDAQEFEITIADHYKIAQVKEEYAKKHLEGGVISMTEADRLMLDREELDDAKEVFRYKIAEGQTLTVQREDISQVTTKYICADCGSEVRLKQKDMVRCRECGYRIVYKKRTTRAACQYLAR